VPERVVAIDPHGAVRTAAGRDDSFDIVVGADGAGSLVRRTFLSPTPPSRLTMAAGWYAPGVSPMVVRFTPGLAGYLWVFPRLDHVGVGICAPLGAVPTRSLLGRLEAEVARAFPAFTDPDAERYGHTIPSPSADPRSILEWRVSGGRWWATPRRWPIPSRRGHLLRAALGPGAGRHASRARLAPRYPAAALEDFGRDLLKAAAIKDRFYAPGFAARMIDFQRAQPRRARRLADLVLGRQGTSA
jgi:hypothetical protein